MFKTANPGRLTDLLDNVFSGNALLQHECRQLATGFVGCNLVADLADFVTNVANSASGGVVGGPAPPSFAKLRGWLIEPPADWDALAELIGPAGAAAMANGSHHFDRWWQINRWLGVEASLQMLAPSSTAAVPPPSVLNHAQATAEKVLAASKAQPQPCRQRNAAVVQAFAPWLRATVEGVARLWRQHGWHQQAGNQHLVGLLVRELGAGCQPLTTLTGTKNNQWLNCLQQLNQACGGRCLTPDGWLAGLGGQVLIAWQAGDDYDFTAADLQHLHTLAGWLPTAGLSPLAADLRKVFAGFLPATAASFPNPYLPRVAGLLEKLTGAIPTRGLPPDWRDSPLVQDLFAYPVEPDFDFTAWAGTLNRLSWMPPPS